MDTIEERIHQLETETAELNRQLASTPTDNPECKVELMKTIRELDRELSDLRYQIKTPKEREQYWVWATNHQMRVQSEAGQDMYVIFSKEWLEKTRAREPRIEEILQVVVQELGLDPDTVTGLVAAEAGSDEWKAVRQSMPEA